jgi:hypothetical protein
MLVTLTAQRICLLFVRWPTSSSVAVISCLTHLRRFNIDLFTIPGGIAVILIIWRIFTFRPWASPVKTKGQKRALTNLATFLVAAASTYL